ncbi:aspartate 1-decarboxylase [Alkalibacillus haloalkaliphilus]|uniref:Aspartate 1-decarboxylase n=1 Tax=Alkalibacillus haloalkaliphilus TaxID=94136 RepID=A0A511W702_9BACI|nr:aspartate 1-decarboxylase [Alkalibacillus haloalkaliphilus]MDV2580806.1 aspartate 1-decarboxylase [Alkalibacillus haloalkaliphilus]GEN45132.1 aspartate 1-decarboxylase [Alkalibacillus haloalkaliphilus]
MYRTMLNSKIHRATVTEADLNYVGSITIDAHLLEQVGILPHEKVQVVNNNNGERFETYVIAGERHSGVICLNGAAARRVQKGDTVIIISYVTLSSDELEGHQPKIAIMDDDNQIGEIIVEEPPLTVL